MANPWFRFKQFTVQQDRCAMKVSTDGVLLGAWTDVTGAERILDIGTGTGLLALIAAQRNAAAAIDAVEVDPEAATQAQENAVASPWADRIHVQQADVLFWHSPARYDLVICNPPFYARYTASRDPRKAVAKHESTLGMGELVRSIDRFCADEGRFGMIIPLDRLEELTKVGSSFGFKPTRVCRVRYLATKPAKRALVEFNRNGAAQLVATELVIELAPGEFSPEYKSLLQDLEPDF